MESDARASVGQEGKRPQSQRQEWNKRRFRHHRHGQRKVPNFGQRKVHRKRRMVRTMRIVSHFILQLFNVHWWGRGK